MQIRQICISALVALAASAQCLASQTSCVLSGPAASVKPVSLADDMSFTLEPTLTSAPAYSEPLPMEIGDQKQCRMHVSPHSGVTRFRLTVTPRLFKSGAPVDGTGVSIQIVSSDPGQFEAEMPPLTVKTGESGTSDLILNPGTRAAREYLLEAHVRISADTTYRLPFTLLWAPVPDLSVRTASTACGTDVCMLAGRTEELVISGLDVAEVDVGKTAKVGYAPPNPVVKTEVGIARTTAGTTILLTAPLAAGTYQLGYTLPLAIPRLSINSAGKVVPVREIEGLVSMEVALPGRGVGLLNYPNNTSLATLRGASAGTRAIFKSQDAAIPALKPRNTYQLRELTGGPQGALVAEFHVDNVDANGIASGTLVPIAPTRVRTGKFDSSEVVLRVDAANEFRVPLTVLPATRVDRYFVLGPRGERQGAAVHPLDVVTIRLEGPAVRHLNSGRFRSNTVTLSPIGARDSVEATFEVPRDARATELLRLTDLDDVEYLVPIAVEPAQRPNLALSTFAWVEHRGMRDRRADFLPGQSADTVRNLGGVVLKVNPAMIESPTKLFGVQYLQLQVDLFDAAGTRVGQHSECLAIVPPPGNGPDYPVRTNCTRVSNDEFAISPLLEATGRATAQSTIRLRVSHDPAQYPNQDVGVAREITLRKRGWWIREPRLQLPGPMVALRGGTMSTALTYAGAVMDFEPMIDGRIGPGSPFRLSFQTGAIIGTAPSGASNGDSFAARLSATAGATFRITNMAGNVTLDFYVGRVAPFSTRGFRLSDHYYIFRPGFSVPL